MVRALEALGINIDARWNQRQISVSGCANRLPSSGAQLNLAGSGTSIRFLTALVATGSGEFTLDGNEQMRKRPIGDLLHALNRLGARATSADGCPPVRIKSDGLKGGSITLKGNLSSQFLSGLLLAAPAVRGEVEIEIIGPLVSKPYINMTIALMHAFGVKTEQVAENCFRVPHPQSYRATEYQIEPDASAASYFWATAAITGGEVLVEGLSRESLQGDVAFCDALQQMGCQVDDGEGGITVRGGKLHGIDIDMNAFSDTAQTLSAVALFAEGTTTIRGIGHVRHKETDRIGNLAKELRNLGAEIIEMPDGFQIVPRALRGGEVETYDDHRMAMSLSLIGLRLPGVTILDPTCTKKTYPEFFDDLERLTASANCR